VVLFDELEKAHPDVSNMLLQILEEGKLTDSQGRQVDFRNTIILLTSNVGAETVRKSSTLGFGSGSEDVAAVYDKMKDRLLDESKRFFKPEFLNRLDDVIVFRSLTKEDLVKILDLEIAKVMERVQRRNLRLVMDEASKEFLVQKGYDPQYGARPMRRAVERHLEDPLAEEILKGSLVDGEPVEVGVDDGKIVFRQTKAVGGALPAETGTT